MYVVLTRKVAESVRQPISTPTVRTFSFYFLIFEYTQKRTMWIARIGSYLLVNNSDDRGRKKWGGMYCFTQLIKSFDTKWP